MMVYGLSYLGAVVGAGLVLWSMFSDGDPPAFP
jgi:hypothetical protein